MLALDLPHCTYHGQPGYCLGRDRIDTLNAMARSEARCRVDLIECRERQGRARVSGVDPWIVVAVAAGALLAGATIGGGVAYLATR